MVMKIQLRKCSVKAKKSALDILKYTTLYGDKGDEMQSINFKFKKLYCTKRLNSLKQKNRTVSFKAI